MRHDGNKLKAIAKAKGFVAQSLADRIEVTPLTVETDFKRIILSRRILGKYVDVLNIDLDNFYDSIAFNNEPIPDRLDMATELTYKDQLLASKDETILEQRKHIETLSNMLRFFPTAAQLVTATA